MAMGERAVSLEPPRIAHRFSDSVSSVSRGLGMNLTFLTLMLPMMGQNPVPIEPVPMPAPFLYVKVIPPKDSQTTWYPESPAAIRLTEPTAVGLRPGYLYRPEMSVVHNGKPVKLYPSLEVRGTLQPPKNLDVSKHPVPLVFTEDDIALVLRGRLITKFVVLESPDKADAIQSNRDQMLEYPLGSERAAYYEAREKGRLVLIVRLGERDFNREELVQSNIPGTILVPGMTTLPIPQYPPYLPFGAVLMYDPILGPKFSTDECLADGGDTKTVIGIGPKQRLTGLDASDTAMEFTLGNKKKVVTSNRVCLCVPRFVSIRADVMLAENTLVQLMQARQQTDFLVRLNRRLLAQDVYHTDVMRGMQVRTRPNGINGTFAVNSVSQLSGKPMAVATQNGTKLVAAVRELEELNATDCKMLLTKWVEPKNPEQIGQEVTFFLKYHNATSGSIEDVVISDSLTGRLEYLPNTQKCDRGATFTTEPNEAGSVVLRWALDGKLKPGEGGIISFKAKIR
jgi:hypothetical protein